MLRAAILIIILVLVLSFFGISLQHLVESPAAHSNFSYVGDLLKQGWALISGLVNGLLKTITHLV